MRVPTQEVGTTGMSLSMIHLLTEFHLEFEGGLNTARYLILVPSRVGNNIVLLTPEARREPWHAEIQFVGMASG